MSTTEANKALVRRFYEQIDAGNLDVLDELVAEDYLDHSPPPWPFPPGRAGLKESFRLFWDVTPGRHVIEDRIADGRLVEKWSDKDVLRMLQQLGVIPAMGPPG